MLLSALALGHGSDLDVLQDLPECEPPLGLGQVVPRGRYKSRFRRSVRDTPETLQQIGPSGDEPISSYESGVMVVLELGQSTLKRRPILGDRFLTRLPFKDPRRELQDVSDDELVEPVGVDADVAGDLALIDSTPVASTLSHLGEADRAVGQSGE